MKLQKFFALMLGIATVAGFTACSSDDDSADYAKTVELKDVKGVTYASSNFFKDMTTFGGMTDVSKLDIEKIGENLVEVDYESNLWGEGDFEFVTVSYNNGAYTLTGKGSMTTPNRSGDNSVSTYPDFTFSGYVAKDSVSFVISGTMGTMGPMSLKFVPGTAVTLK